MSLPQRHLPKVARPGKPVSREAAGLLFADLADTLTVTERAFLQRLREREILQPDREYKAIADRRFRIDWAWPEQKLALEVEGGVWTGGRHTRGGGFLADMEKYNLLAVAGWRLLRCQPKELANYATIDLIARALNHCPGT